MADVPAVPEGENGEVWTVGDLSEEHRGWLVKVLAQDGIASHRTILLSSSRGWNCVRRWTRPDGLEMVGLLDRDSDRSVFVGTERVYPMDTPCELLRKVKRTR